MKQGWLLIFLLPLVARADIPQNATIGVHAETGVGSPMSVDIPIIQGNERLLFKATSSFGTIKIHENGHVESTMPTDIAADQFYAALSLLGKAFSYNGPRICYVPSFAPENPERPL